MKRSYKDTANNYELWVKYVCNDDFDDKSCDRFYKMNVQERINYLIKHFGKECENECYED